MPGILRLTSDTSTVSTISSLLSESSSVTLQASDSDPQSSVSDLELGFRLPPIPLADNANRLAPRPRAVSFDNAQLHEHTNLPGHSKLAFQMGFVSPQREKGEWTVFRRPNGRPMGIGLLATLRSRTGRRTRGRGRRSLAQQTQAQTEDKTTSKFRKTVKYFNHNIVGTKPKLAITPSSPRKLVRKTPESLHTNPTPSRLGAIPIPKRPQLQEPRYPLTSNLRRASVPSQTSAAPALAASRPRPLTWAAPPPTGPKSALRVRVRVSALDKTPLTRKTPVKVRFDCDTKAGTGQVRRAVRRGAIQYG
ncbi:hypothetical protein C8F01DRAFT_1373126 [Mycena amicta]|nr:hypothetical protein C8F01DRAFT_1373126 [Mycena amicta]